MQLLLVLLLLIFFPLCEPLFCLLTDCSVRGFTFIMLSGYHPPAPHYHHYYHSSTHLLLSSWKNKYIWKMIREQQLVKTVEGGKRKMSSVSVKMRKENSGRRHMFIYIYIYMEERFLTIWFVFRNCFLPCFVISTRPYIQANMLINRFMYSKKVSKSERR